MSDQTALRITDATRIYLTNTILYEEPSLGPIASIINVSSDTIYEIGCAHLENREHPAATALLPQIVEELKRRRVKLDAALEMLTRT